MREDVQQCPTGVPEHLWPGIQRYVQHGIQPGGFLMALFAGDLFEVFQRADVQSLKHLMSLVWYIDRECPAACFGSRDKIQAWVAVGGLEGISRTVH